MLYLCKTCGSGALHCLGNICCEIRIQLPFKFILNFFDSSMLRQNKVKVTAVLCPCEQYHFHKIINQAAVAFAVRIITKIGRCWRDRRRYGVGVLAGVPPANLRGLPRWYKSRTGQPHRHPSHWKRQIKSLQNKYMGTMQSTETYTVSVQMWKIQ